MHAQSCTIGVDLGTTSAKAVAFDLDGHEIVSASQPIALINRHDGETEQDAFAVAAAASHAQSARRVLPDMRLRVWG